MKIGKASRDIAKKSRHAKHVIERLESLKLIQKAQIWSLLIVKESEVELTLSKIKAVQERLMKASIKLAEHHLELKQKQVLIQYYKYKDTTNETCAEASMVCGAIERAFSFLKGKHNTTKAK